VYKFAIIFPTCELFFFYFDLLVVPMLFFIVVALTFMGTNANPLHHLGLKNYSMIKKEN